jgi:hypothetical protein
MPWTPIPPLLPWDGLGDGTGDIQRTLAHWQKDADLASLREKDASDVIVVEWSSLGLSIALDTSPHCLEGRCTIVEGKTLPREADGQNR